MQKINKTTSAPLAAVLFILSLAIMPFSLRVVGFTLSLNPSMYAVVDVWNQIAGSLGGGYGSAELIAINNLYSNEASGAALDAASGLLAKLERPDAEQIYQPQFSAIEAEDFAASAPQVKCLKASSRRARAVKRVGVDSYYREIQARIGQHAEALKAAEFAQREITAQREVAARGSQLMRLEHLAAMRIDVGKMLKGFTFNKDVKVFVKMRPVKPVAAARLTACDLRKALTGERIPEVRTREARVTEPEATSFE